MPMSTTLDTIGALIDNEHNLRAYCNNPECHHYVKLGLGGTAPEGSQQCANRLVSNAQNAVRGMLAKILSSNSTEGFGHV
jgi:hypothetical protein